jgi:hypothetical protein
MAVYALHEAARVTQAAPRAQDARSIDRVVRAAPEFAAGRARERARRRWVNPAGWFASALLPNETACAVRSPLLHSFVRPSVRPSLLRSLAANSLGLTLSSNPSLPPSLPSSHPSLLVTLPHGSVRVPVFLTP